jgi:hypothetical protein
MGVDAIALLRPRRTLPKALQRRSTFLKDGAALYRTLHRFGWFEAEPSEARDALEDLAGVHDDERGLFLFPDVCEPSARTYAKIIEEIGDAGVWLALDQSAAERAQALNDAREVRQAAGRAKTRAFMQRAEDAMRRGVTEESEEGRRLVDDMFELVGMGELKATIDRIEASKKKTPSKKATAKKKTSSKKKATAKKKAAPKKNATAKKKAAPKKKAL